MIIAPIEIQKKEFSKAFRGYNEEEVKDFLDKITISYEQVYKENQDLKEQLVMMKEKLKSYENLETTLKETLVLAQKTAEEIKSNAQKERDVIIKEAMIKANQIIQRAEAKCNHMLNQYEELRREFVIYKTRFINFLKSQLELINSCELDIKEQTENQDYIQEAAITSESVDSVYQESINIDDNLNNSESEFN